MEFEDYTRLISAIRRTADALRREADFVDNLSHAEILRDRAEACARRAAEMERDLPLGFPSYAAEKAPIA